MVYKIKITVTFLLVVFSLSQFAQQWNGHTLIARLGNNNCYTIDTNGVVMHTWTISGGPTSYPAYMYPGGTVLRTVGYSNGITPTHGGMYTTLQKLDYNSNVVWQWQYANASYNLHHDVTILPNGNILACVCDRKLLADMQAAGGTCTVSPFLTERIIEIQPVGTNSANIVWEWKMWDHLMQNTNSLVATYQASMNLHPELININHIPTWYDQFHMNGLDYNPVLDQIAFGGPLRCEWMIIDHSTNTAEAASHVGGNSGKGGDILYRYGNPAAYGAAGPQVLNYNHDAHWIPEGCPDAGYLSGICNSCAGGSAAIDHVKPPRVGYNYTINPGSAFTPTTFNSRYACPGSTGQGNSEQFPNGNQMICFNTSVFEVNAGGTLLWSYTLPSGGQRQAHRYSPCYINNPPPAQPSITVTGATLSCSGNNIAWQWYMNGDAVISATNQSFVPPLGQTGIYLVRARDINNCMYLYSSGKLFTPPPPPPIPTGVSVNEGDLSKIQIYPNPTTGQVFIEMNNVSENFLVEVRSSTGQLILTENNKSKINLSEVSNGIYFINIKTNKGNISKKITLLK